MRKCPDTPPLLTLVPPRPSGGDCGTCGTPLAEIAPGVWTCLVCYLRQLTSRARAGAADPGPLLNRPLGLAERVDVAPMVQCPRCDYYTHALATSGLCWECDLGWRHCPIHGRRERYGTHRQISVTEALAELRDAARGEQG